MLGKHFGNAADATTVVTEIEQIIEMRIDAKKDVLATKEDISRVEIKLLDANLKLHEKLNDQFKWLIGIIVAIVSLAVAVIKLA